MPDQNGPPTYSEATGSKASVSNIPSQDHRLAENDTRELPTGWVRTYDSKNSHHFFVDTASNPPRSIWHHPYDDEQYLSTLPSAERERIESLQQKPIRNENIPVGTTQEYPSHPSNFANLPSRPEDKGKGKQSYGRRLKDKLTGTTHEQRELERYHRNQEEEAAYKQQIHAERAMAIAEETGQPQFLGKDHNGYDVYVEPSYGVRPMIQQQGQLVNPYASGVYQNPNARFIRSGHPYGQQYGRGYGYGGGLGAPIAGGLLGGVLLGSLLF